MAYVGRGLNQTGGQYRKLDDISSGFDGDATGFSLTVDNLEVTPTAQNLMISINGVIQDPGTAFTVVGSTITFTGAPASSSDFFGVVMGEASYIAYGTVGASEMGVSEGAVTGSKGVVVDGSKNIQGINQVTASYFKGDGTGITGVTAEWDGTHTGNGVITGDFNVTGNVTGSKVSASLGEFTSATIEGGTISGITDLAVADGGTGASSLNDLITLTTHTTGNYVGTLTGGTGITSTGATTGEGIAHSISVDASQTQITGLSTVTTGVWNSTFGSTANALISGSFGNQRIGTSDSPTFADGTYTSNLGVSGSLTVKGMVTAEEFHTEFVSASIVYKSGSTKFGDTSDDIHQFSGSLRVTGSGDHYFTDGNVGIGTTAPANTLHVQKDVDDYIAKFENDGNSTSSNGLWVDTRWNTATNTVFRVTSNSGTADFFYIKGDGNVGIGNTAPSQPLTVEGNISGSGTGSFGVLKTGDIELENERGHWKIIEESEYLSIYNVKTDKKFKFVLEEIE